MSAGHQEQLKAWALDRAIETLKHQPANCTPGGAIQVAEQYVQWVSVKEEADEGETLPEVQQ